MSNLLNTSSRSNTRILHRQHRASPSFTPQFAVCCCCCSNKTYDLDQEPTANTLALTMRNFIIFQYHALLTHFNVLKTLVQIDGVIIRCSYFLANFDTVTWIISSYLSYGRVALLVWTVFVPSVKSHNFSNFTSVLWNIKLLLIIKPSSVNFK